MTTTERVSYLKGLMEGLELDYTTKEGKVLKAMFEVLEDVTLDLADLSDEVNYLDDKMDEIDEDLGAVEELVYDLDDDCDCECDCDCDDDCDCGCDCGCDCDCEEDDCDCCDGDYYEVECPECKEMIYFDPELLDSTEIECPNCGAEIELDFSEEEETDEDLK